MTTSAIASPMAHSIPATPMQTVIVPPRLDAILVARLLNAILEAQPDRAGHSETPVNASSLTTDRITLLSVHSERRRASTFPDETTIDVALRELTD